VGVQVLISAYDDECKLNALWVLGSLLDGNTTLQRTLVQHDGPKLLLRLCRPHATTPLHPPLHASDDEEEEGGEDTPGRGAGHAFSIENAHAAGALPLRCCFLAAPLLLACCCRALLE